MYTALQINTNITKVFFLWVTILTAYSYVATFKNYYYIQIKIFKI